MKMITCVGCSRPILDRYLLNVSDEYWHSECVKCVECKVKLSEKCFSRDGKLFCRQDFFKKFGTKCSGCLQGILPTDFVRRTKSNQVYHLKCFTCFICRKQLSTGEELYVTEDNKFICTEDFHSSSRSHHGWDSYETGSPGSSHDSLSEESCPSAGTNSIGGGIGTNESSSNHTYTPDRVDGSGLDWDQDRETEGLVRKRETPPFCPVGPVTGHSAAPASNGSAGGGGSSSSGGAGNDENTPGTKRRGPRTTIKAKQLETLKNAFNQTPKPTRHIREQLAAETGLNMRVIQVWFQNRRSKERRMKQVNSMGARRHFFRSPRRAMRPLRPGGLGTHDDLDDSPEMVVGGPVGPFGFYTESNDGGDFGYPGPNPGQHPHHPGPPGGPPPGPNSGGAGGPPFYDPFFGPGSGGPYPGDPHPHEGSGGGGPNGGPLGPQTTVTGPGPEPSLPGLESAGGWPLAQM